jgi:hypothetical protein
MLQGSATPYYPTPELVNQYCTHHLGIVKSLSDPKKRGRVCVEVPGLIGEGEENWTAWVEMSGNNVGSNVGKGDEGIWWPAQVGQTVLVGFISGDPFVLWAVPGPPVNDGKKPMIPSEPRSYEKEREVTRCRVLKSEAGHTLLMDDNGKKEILGLMSWTGAGLIFLEGGKEEDEQEEPLKESKPRKGERREIKNIWEGTSKKPSELLEDKKSYIALTDLNGQGIIMTGDDEKGGQVAVYARKKPDEDPTISFVMDTDKNELIITCGKAQIIMKGETGKIYSTSQIIKEQEIKDVKEYIKTPTDKIKERMEKYKSNDSGGSGESSGSGGGSS